MLFDKEMNVISTEKTSDSMGGWITEEVIKGTIEVATSSVTAEYAMKEYGLISTTALKVFFDEMPICFESTDTVEVKGKRYTIVQLMDYDKLFMLLLNEVSK